MKNFEKNRGISILGVIIFVAIGILVLSYFNISIKGVVNSPTGQENINYVKGGTEGFWAKYLERPASYLWNDVWVRLFWRPFIDNMERIKNNMPTDIDNASPKVNFISPH